MVDTAGQALAAFGAVTALVNTYLISFVSAARTPSNPPLTPLNLAHDVTGKVVEVGALCFVFQE